MLNRMSLPPGARLGPYEILSLLGKGGMGGEYRAGIRRSNRRRARQNTAARFAAYGCAESAAGDGVVSAMDRMLRRVGLAVIVAFAASIGAHAQWLNYKTPGVPRTADGKPKL